MKVLLDISCEVSEESIDHALHLLHPRLEAQLMLAKQVTREIFLFKKSCSFDFVGLLD